MNPCSRWEIFVNVPNITVKRIQQVYRESDLQEEKNRVACSLGNVQSDALIQRVLEFSLSVSSDNIICTIIYIDDSLQDEVRSQDTVFVIGNVAFNPVGRQAAWQFFQDKQQTFIDRYGAGYLICRLIKLVTENFTTEEQAAQVEKFFVDNKFPGSERSVQQSVETIRLNAAILKRDAQEVKIYLDSL